MENDKDPIKNFIAEFEKSLESDGATPKSPKKNILDFERGIINFDVRYRSLNSQPIQIQIAERKKNTEPIFNNSHYGPIRQNNMFEDLQPFVKQQLQKEIKQNLNKNLLNADIKKTILNKESTVKIIQSLYSEFENQYMEDLSLKQKQILSYCYQFDELSGQFMKTDNYAIDPCYKNYSFDTSVKGTAKKVQHLYQRRYQESSEIKQFAEIESNFQLSGQKLDVEKSEINLEQMLQDNMKIIKILSLDSNEWKHQQDYEKIVNEEQKVNKKENNVGSNHNQQDQYYDLWNNIQKEVRNEEKAEKIHHKTYNYQLQKIQTQQEFLSYVEKIQFKDDIEIEKEKEKELILLQKQQQRALKQNADDVTRKFRVIKLSDITARQQKQSGNSEWAVEDDTDLMNFYDILPRENFAIQYDFELDDFQKRAILRLEKQESVLICAHTSAGKTVVAEYAIALSQKHKRRVVYTSPIKALSNEKYRKFHKKYHGDVGIITGDVTLNPQASCLIMTTEILRNMLYKGNDVIRDIEWVIFDEVHYVNNEERGVVWEETIIMLPEHVGIIMLSATVPNYKDFANWVGRTKQKQIYIQKTFIRPVPLEHSIYIFNKFHIIKEKDGPFLEEEFEGLKYQIDSLFEEKVDIRELKKQQKLEKKEAGTYKDKRITKQNQYVKKQASSKFISKLTKDDVENPNNRDDQRNVVQLIRHCQKQELLPCVFFIFSKAKIKALSEGCQGIMLNLNTKAEEAQIVRYFDKAVKKLKDQDQTLPQLMQLRDQLKQGIAVHHGDLLPIAKEIVEILFSEGKIKVLFATETFAMGINMPTKTVIFYSLKKHDGKELRYLNSSEYTQMSGRAGRRGLDEKGNVIVYIQNLKFLPEKADLKKIVDHQGVQLQSKYKITYAVILNKLNSKELDVVDMMRQSFSENAKFSTIKSNQKKVKRLREECKTLSQFECPYKPKALEKDAPIEQYFNTSENLKDQNLEYLFQDKEQLRSIQMPKFGLIIGYNNVLELGVILKFQNLDSKISEEILVDVLFVNNTNIKKQKIVLEFEEKNQKPPQNQALKEQGYSYKIVSVYCYEILEIFDDKINVRVQDQHNQSYQEVSRILIEKLEQFDPQSYYIQQGKQKKSVLQRKKFKASKKYSQKNQNDDDEEDDKDNLWQTKKNNTVALLESQCTNCEQQPAHLSQIQKRKNIAYELQDTLKDIDENELKFMDIFEGRVQVLKHFQYIDENNQPLIKARIARELGEGEIYLCELIVDNIFSDLKPAEIAAILSGFVCQYKPRQNNNQYQQQKHLLDIFQEDEDQMWRGHVKVVVEQVYSICEKILKEEIANQILFIDDFHQYLYDNVLNFNLAKVIYEWCKGKNFIEILEQTDAQEGQIVKTILRLENLLKNFKNAARIVGHMPLFKKIEVCQESIKRDIVFTQSLYLEED